jgi:hypothetical protein
VLAGILVRVLPGWFLPFYEEGIYQAEENATCIRALGSIRNIAPHVGIFLGFFFFEVYRRDWRAVGMMAVMALGFALPFAIGGYWHTFHGSALRLPWWKHWEMSIGLGGGLAFGLAFWLFNRPETDSPPRPVTRKERIWGAALPVMIACGWNISNAYEGFVRHHEVAWPSWIRPVITDSYFHIAIPLFVIWILRTRALPDERLQRPEAVPLPRWVMPAVLLSIVICGYIVSIPPQVRLANAELLGLYTFYILASLFLVRRLKKERC